LKQTVFELYRSGTQVNQLVTNMMCRKS